MSKLFQNVINQMKDTTSRVIGIIDDQSNVCACSKSTLIGESRQGVKDDVLRKKTLCVGGFTYSEVKIDEGDSYIIFIEGEDDEAIQMSKLLSISFSNLKNLYDEKYDKTSFVKNILLDNILPSEIFIKCKELHFEYDAVRIAYIIKFANESDALPINIIQNIFPEINHDFVLNMGESDIALIKEFPYQPSYEQVEKIAYQISDTLQTEFFTKVFIGIGTASNNLKELSKSYKEAQIAIEVGKIFDSDKNIMSYENLGIGRLIYQLPSTLCDMYISEIFRKGQLEDLDREIITTINMFFENNLNVSETARKMFIHRNTLIYRLEKVKRLTGIDIRDFDNAVTFRVAIMVKKYMDNKPTRY